MLQALEKLLSDERVSGYQALIDAAVADPARLERYAAAAEVLYNAICDMLYDLCV